MEQEKTQQKITNGREWESQESDEQIEERLVENEEHPYNANLNKTENNKGQTNRKTKKMNKQQKRCARSP
jgi:hypothetical protein